MPDVVRDAGGRFEGRGMGQGRLFGRRAQPLPDRSRASVPHRAGRGRGPIHRAFEWSTAKSYAELRALGADLPRPKFEISEGQDWLQNLVRAAASQSNTHYEKLIAHYDINKGVVDPPSGLDVVAQRILAELIRTASALFATVLQRAITESGVKPPEVSLTLDTVLATRRSRSRRWPGASRTRPTENSSNACMTNCARRGRWRSTCRMTIGWCAISMPPRSRARTPLRRRWRNLP
ncbi:MAG: hypothetical protein R3D67_03820 [Hyphomicrobiaceae bacterium]